MDIREISAEKIRAMNDRVRYRDFYDFTAICAKLKVDLREAIALVRRKEIRHPISPQNIWRNWLLAKKDAATDNQSLFFSEKLDIKIIEEFLKYLSFDEIK